MTEISIEAALTGFLTDRREHDSPRQFRAVSKVITSLRRSIAKNADQPAGDIPAGQITGHIGHLIVEVLPHEEFAAASELTAARRVLSSLLRWLGEHGCLDAGTVTAAIEDIAERLDERAEVKRCVDALGSCVRPVSPDILATVPYGDRVVDRYMHVCEVTEESVTFVDAFKRYARLGGAGIPELPRVGPFTVPPEVAEATAPGWDILLSAARVNGEWRLLNVVSGDP